MGHHHRESSMDDDLRAYGGKDKSLYERRVDLNKRDLRDASLKIQGLTRYFIDDLNVNRIVQVNTS